MSAWEALGFGLLLPRKWPPLQSWVTFSLSFRSLEVGVSGTSFPFELSSVCSLQAGASATIILLKLNDFFYLDFSLIGQRNTHTNRPLTWTPSRPWPERNDKLGQCPGDTLLPSWLCKHAFKILGSPNPEERIVKSHALKHFRGSSGHVISMMYVLEASWDYVLLVTSYF